MKKLFILLIIAALLLTACTSSGTPSVQDIRMFDVSFTVDLQRQTVTDGYYVYRFSIKDNTVTITYPNQVRYWQELAESDARCGWDDGYTSDSSPYISGEKLVQVVSTAQPAPKTIPPALAYGILALLGAWYVFFPKAALMLILGFLFKNSQPPKAAKIAIQLFGCMLWALDIYWIFF